MSALTVDDEPISACTTHGTANWRGLIQAVGVLVLVLLSLLVPLPEGGRLFHAAADAMHAPLFALAAVILYPLIARRRGQPSIMLAVSIWLSLLTFGVVIEACQSWLGRSASWHDAVANGCGALGGTWFADHSQRRSRIRLASIVFALALVGAGATPALLEIIDTIRQHLEFPKLASFEDRWELGRWSVWDRTRIACSSQWATDGQSSLRIDMEPGRYSGIGMKSPPGDWRGNNRLRMDVFVEQVNAPVCLLIKIIDQDHGATYADRYNREFELKTGHNPIRIDLIDVMQAPQGRVMDMAKIKSLQLVIVNPEQGSTMYVDRIGLD